MTIILKRIPIWPTRRAASIAALSMTLISAMQVQLPQLENVSAPIQILIASLPAPLFVRELPNDDPPSSTFPFVQEEPLRHIDYDLLAQLAIVPIWWQSTPGERAVLAGSMRETLEDIFDLIQNCSAQYGLQFVPPMEVPSVTSHVDADHPRISTGDVERQGKW